MASPVPADSNAIPRGDLAITLMEYDLQAAGMGYIGTKVFPVIEVNKQNGRFGKIEIEQLLQEQSTRRASSGAYSRGQFESTSASYLTEEHGWEEPIDKREAAIYSDYFDVELVSAARARSFVMRNHEKRVATLMNATGTHTTDTATAALTDSSGSDIVKDVTERKVAIRNATGITPNAVVLEWEAYQWAVQSAAVLDKVKYVEGTLPADITVGHLARAFEVPYVFVPNAQKNTADQGQTASLGSVWDKTQCLVTHVATDNDLRNPCAGRTFHWGEDGSNIGTLLESYYEEQTRSDIIRARMETDEKELYPEVTQIITGVLA